MMTNALLSLLLVAQLMISPTPAAHDRPAAPQQTPLWWGLIDPELALWFSRLPLEEADNRPVLWDFSWRGFLASLFERPALMEEVPDASRV